MNSNPCEFQINYEENLKLENDENLFQKVMEQLNKNFGEEIEISNLVSNKKLNEIEKNKNSDSNAIEDKRRKKAITELLKYYKKANVDKTIKFKLSPFKRLMKPKKIQMNGRILLNNQEN